METELPQAPPVVAVVVVHDPGDWFEATLDALAAQDYPNLRFLFLVAEPGPETRRRLAEQLDARSDEAIRLAFEASMETRIKVRVPSSFVRPLVGRPGFGPAVNEVLRLVEGDNGFFLICHDDIAPDPDAVRMLVEEMYRSNAGVVGPKLVDWDRPNVLQSVGLGLDRFGEIEQPIEPGEVDQEQHDGVRDVFVVPSACMLVRADLFRELGGFDDAVDLLGEDVDLCWRVHHGGARVVVAPLARVRHRSRLAERRPDLPIARVAARHRLRAVATLTGAPRLPLRLLELVVLTIGELVVGLFTGRFREAVASMRALIGLVPRIGSILRRRRTVAAGRRVPEREVLGLQERGSARLSAFLRSRDTTTLAGSDQAVRRWRESTSAPVIAWIVVLVGLVVGSRSFFTNGVPAVGDFLPVPESPRDLLGAYASGWNPSGTGAAESNPTGWAAMAVTSIVTLFRMGAFQIVLTVGMVVLGLIGLWKLATVFPSTRARIMALAVYAACPLVGGAMAIGSFDTLVAYAAVPWFIHKAARAAGVTTADPRSADDDVADGVLDLPAAERARRILQLGVVVALAAAFAPVLLVVALVVGVLLAIGSALAMAPLKTAGWFAASTVGAVVIAVLLNIPWIGTWSWSGIVDPAPVGEAGRGLLSVAAFEIGPTTFAYLALALYLPVVAGLLLARAWRLTWAVRAGLLVVVFGAAAVLGDRGDLPFAAPPTGLLLAPVAVGLAISAAASLAAFDLDVRGGTFGWRQPLGLAAGAAAVVGLLPGVLAIGDGDWDTPSSPIGGLTQRILPPADSDDPDDGVGDYRVLLVGDARLLPAWSHEYRDGISYSVITDDDLDMTARWPSPTTDLDDRIVDALDQISIGSTQRAGQLLAPLGIRYVSIPLIDGIVSTNQDPLPAPIGLVEAFDEQLDIVTFAGGLRTTVEIFENTAWIPSQALLTGEAADTSRLAGNEPLVRADLTDVEPVFVGADHLDAMTEEIGAGVLHVSVPFDDGWTLTVDGSELSPRRAFGATTAFDVEQGGTATLEYRTGTGRRALVALQLALWLLALFGALRVAVPSGRPRTVALADETLIHLDDELPSVPAGDAVAFDPGMDVTGAIDRPDALDAELEAGPDVDRDEPGGLDGAGDVVDEPGSEMADLAEPVVDGAVDGTGEESR